MIGKKKEQRKSQLFSQSRTGRRESNHRKSMIVGEEEKRKSGKGFVHVIFDKIFGLFGWVYEFRAQDERWFG